MWYVGNVIKWWKMPAACKMVVVDRHDYYKYDGDDHGDNYDHNDDVACGQCDQVVEYACSLFKNIIMIRTMVSMMAFSWKDVGRKLGGCYQILS